MHREGGVFEVVFDDNPGRDGAWHSGGSNIQDCCNSGVAWFIFAF
jgi:hypothetical protein